MNENERTDDGKNANNNEWKYDSGNEMNLNRNYVGTFLSKLSSLLGVG